MKKTALTIVATLFINSPVLAKDTLIGVLEQPQICGGTSTFSTRVLFAKQGSNWAALGAMLPSTNWNVESVKWVIAFDGTNLGRVSITEPVSEGKYINDWFYRRDKIHKLVGDSKLPKIINKAKSFGGWCSIPEYRPLVIVSENNYKDPQKWKAFSAGSEYKEKLYPFLKVAIGKLGATICRSDVNIQSVPYKYGPLDTVIYGSYKSSNGQELISIGLNPNDYNCDGPRSPEWTGNWFLISKNEIEFIGNELELVDAGDYDNDGSSELLFWHSGYNSDGYVLIYNEFRQKAVYTWGYH